MSHQQAVEFADGFVHGLEGAVLVMVVVVGVVLAVYLRQRRRRW